MLCAQRKGKCNIFRGKTSLPVGTPADMPHGGSLVLSFPSAEGRPSADTAVRRWRRLYALGGCGQWPPSAAGGAGAHRQGQKGTGHHMVSCPLLTPQTFLCADTSEMCSETGVAGARFRASGRFWDAVMPRIFLALSAAHDSARPDGAGRSLCAANRSASIKCCILEHQTSLWAPRF